MRSLFVRRMLAAVLTLAVVITAVTGCKKKEEKTLRIAGKTYTEAQLTSEIIAQLLEKEGFKIERKYDLGSSICFESIVQGEVDLYPDYTGSLIFDRLKLDVDLRMSKEEAYELVKAECESQKGLIVLPDMGFNNTYANAIRSDFAEANNIKTDSDLAAFSSDLIFGGEHSFYERELDGYDPMCETYGYSFKDIVKMDVAIKETAIKNKEVDVVVVYTTDGWLEGSGLTVLEDDKSFFPSYYVCPVVRKDILEKYPEIESILSVLNDSTTEEVMIYYNNLVDVQGKTIADAAADFIKNVLKIS